MLLCMVCMSARGRDPTLPQRSSCIPPYVCLHARVPQSNACVPLYVCVYVCLCRMLVKSLNAYVTVCAKEASTAEAGRSATQPKTTPASSSPVARITSAAAQLTNEPQADAVPAPPASTKARLTRAAAQATKPESDVCDEPWVQLWEDRVWEVSVCKVCMHYDEHSTECCAYCVVAPASASAQDIQRLEYMHSDYSPFGIHVLFRILSCLSPCRRSPLNWLRTCTSRA